MGSFVLVLSDIMAKDTIKQYQDNPPMPINAEEELFLWKRRWEFLS